MSQALTFQDHSVRVHTEGEQLWFVAKDVCKVLGIAWSSHTLDAIPAAWKGVVKLATPFGKRGGGKQTLRTINEAGTYKLAFRSNKPEADAFTNWVASEVLPSIRKTGKYEAGGKAKPRQRALPPAKPALLPAPISTYDKLVLTYIPFEQSYNECQRLEKAFYDTATALWWEFNYGSRPMNEQAFAAVHALTNVLYSFGTTGSAVKDVMQAVRKLMK
ncbi:MAG: hypothetical protein FWF99_00160 [Desulfovibrionaceae bacterium]|nr:hypothetical protein [Desulfovibrionaceae bacterium]